MRVQRDFSPEVVKHLQVIPENTLARFLVKQCSTKKESRKERISLEGIWENAGFDKIDVESEIKRAHKEITSFIDARKF